MSNVTAKLIYIGNDVNANVYQIPSNQTGVYTIIKGLNFCAPTANTTFSVHVLNTSGSTPTTSNIVLSNVSITKDETIFYDTSILIAAGSAIHIIGSSSQPVTTMINGVEYS